MRKAAWSVLLLSVAACGSPASVPAAAPTPSTSNTGSTTSSPAVTVLASAAASATAAVPASPSPLATVVATSAALYPVPALDAPFHGPRGLAFDANGNLFVTQCEWTWASIDKIDPNGLVTRFAGTGKPGFDGDGGPATTAQLKCPTGIAVGPDGAVFFADHLNNRIRRVDSAGMITTFAGSGPAGLNLGSYSGDGGQATQATLQEPWGVAFDPAGRLYIADRDNVRVRMVRKSGEIKTVAGYGRYGSAGDGGPAIEAQMCPPVGVAINPAGELVIPDACETTIRVVDLEGTMSVIARTDSRDSPPDTGSEGNTTFDLNGSMLVQAGPSIFRIDESGAVTPVAGNGSIGLPVDGSAAVGAPLPVEIWGLAVDADGNIYVADGATSVWRIDLHGLITRFAGLLP